MNKTKGRRHTKVSNKSPWLNDILDGPFLRSWPLLSRPNTIDDTFSFVGIKQVKRVWLLQSLFFPLTAAVATTTAVAQRQW